jgi:nitrite reductase/ring-hydroxylating ferredoxin subunit
MQEEIAEEKTTHWIPAAEAESIAPGEFKCVSIEGRDIDIFNVDGEFYAMGDVCTHAATPLSEGEFYEDMRGWVIECPLHGSQFDVTTGAAISLPATGNAGKYEVCVEDGQILVNPNPTTPFGL